MGRIRTVKPELFKHGELFDAEQDAKLPLRLAFIALFTCCDREGRFKWRPRELKVDCLPHDNVDFAKVLDALSACGLVSKYEVEGQVYGCIPSWNKHQHVNLREAQSAIPAPEQGTHVHAPVRHVHARGEGKGKEGKGKEGESTPSDVPVIPITVPAPELNWPRWAGEQTRAKWTEFVAYRKREHRKAYKSTSTEQKALDLACRWFQSGPVLWTALEHTMAKGWQFPVDPSEHKYPEPNIPGVVNAKPVWNPRA